MFTHSQPIQNVQFSGCTASRKMSDQVLVICSATGQEYRYRYVKADGNWYRLMVTKKERRLSWIGVVVKQATTDYGPILGPIIGLRRVASQILKMLVVWSIILLAVGGVFVLTEAVVVDGYSHLGTEVTKRMARLVQLIEFAMIGLLVLSELAGQMGGHFYRVVVPLCCFGALLLALYYLCPSLGVFFETVSAFCKPKPS
jgi:hypothetical protein